ncbi:alpha/beta fold hydrolase, partial [bacterium]|nr:alpha/beta fold hydrolase [bacterium]
HCPIIFIHGIASGVEKWAPVAELISDHQSYEMRYLDSTRLLHNYMGDKPTVWVWNVSYYTPDVGMESMTGDLNLYAKRLDRIIQTIAKLTGETKMILVAHSMGGLVARKAMMLHPENSRNVVAVLTVGTPHAGVDSSIPIVGQLSDLGTNSDFIQQLNREWSATTQSTPIRWGVIGGVVTSNLSPSVTKTTTDLGGPGFVSVQSAIPFGEWKAAISNLGGASFGTFHFGFRALVPAQHEVLLTHPMTLRGIMWAVTKPSSPSAQTGASQ